MEELQEVVERVPRPTGVTLPPSEVEVGQQETQEAAVLPQRVLMVFRQPGEGEEAQASITATTLRPEVLGVVEDPRISRGALAVRLRPWGALVELKLQMLL